MQVISLLFSKKLALLQKFRQLYRWNLWVSGYLAAFVPFDPINFFRFSNVSQHIHHTINQLPDEWLCFVSGFNLIDAICS